ncbi:MAG: immunoglobulin [Eubacteriales bacterium]|nr:immunoglobulin [Eubacteriales bacterium]
MSSYHLTKAEMETIVNYDEELPTATIYTFDQRMIRKLKELEQKYPDQFVMKRKGPGRAVTYEFPKRCFGIRPPYSENRRKQQIMDAKTNGSPFAEQEKS